MLRRSVPVLCAMALSGCENEASVAREELIGSYRPGHGDVTCGRSRVTSVIEALAPVGFRGTVRGGRSPPQGGEG